MTYFRTITIRLPVTEIVIKFQSIIERNILLHSIPIRTRILYVVNFITSTQDHTKDKPRIHKTIRNE